MLDYYSCHLPLDKLTQMTEKQLRLFLYLLHEMANDGERFTVRTAHEIHDAIRLHPPDLSRERKALEALKLITFRKAHGDKWAYEAVNPANDGQSIRKLSYIQKGKLIPEDIARYAAVRLRHLRSVTTTASYIADCPLCGDPGTFALRREFTGAPGEYHWQCKGSCRDKSFIPAANSPDRGDLVLLEQTIARRKNKPQTYKQVLYKIERIIQNKLLDFDPDEGENVKPLPLWKEELPSI